MAHYHLGLVYYILQSHKKKLWTSVFWWWTFSIVIF